MIAGAVLLVLAATIGLFLLLPRNARPGASSGKLSVAATFLPVADIVRNIGGADVDIVTLLPPGASPHTFQPTPLQVQQLQDVKTIFAIGHGIDDWSLTLAQNKPDIEVVTLDKNIQLRHAADGSVDPHYWLDAANGKIMAQNVAAELSKLNPSHAADFNRRFQTYASELDALDTQIRILFQGKTQNQIVAHHDAWEYFAAAYGLKVDGVLEPVPGRDLTPRELAALENTIKQDNIKTVFSEPELSSQLLLPLAKDTGVNIVNLDPEGGSNGIASYRDILFKNAQTIANNLE